MWSDTRCEIDEVLACDDRVIATRIAARGHASDGAGEAAFLVGHVTVVEGGRVVSLDQYDYDDDAAMLARYAELSGASATPARRQAELLFAECGAPVQRPRSRGIAGVLRRSLDIRRPSCLGLGAMHGRATLERFYASVFQTSLDIRQEIDEVLACDDRVIAASTTLRGSGTEGVGEFEGSLGQVAVFESGHMVSLEIYEHDDRVAMVARYAELGGGQGPLGDRAPERVLAEYARRFARRDPQPLFELLRARIW